MYKIALVEDEKNLANLVLKYLEAAIMLPGEISGFDLLKAIRHKGNNLPIIFTSARDKDIDKIMGLELGGDDYLAKPYSIRELVLRVKNIITRTYQNDRKISNSRLIIGEYEIDKERRSVYQKGEIIQLTSKEYDLLLYFVDNIGMAFSRDQILNQIWGDDYFGSDRVVDDLLRRLRQKMPSLNVETIYGYGYRLTA